MTDPDELIEVRLPTIAEDSKEHPVRFLKQPGDHVDADEAVVEVETGRAPARSAEHRRGGGIPRRSG